MKQSIYFALLLLVMQSCGTRKDPYKSENPVSMAGGKSATGWHVYGKEGTGPWTVSNGVFHLPPGTERTVKGDLVSSEEYGDFHLSLEWKISKGGNSGIMLFVKEDPAKFPGTVPTALEMQVLDNDGHKDGKIPKHRAGDLYDLIGSSSEPVKPVGEWNHVEVISNKGMLRFIMNGTEIVSTRLWDDNWKAMVAGSKFKAMPAFGTFQSGKIALQDHNNEVWYRNVKIKRL